MPLVVWGYIGLSSGTDNVIAALEKRDRVRDVNFNVADRQLHKVLAAMQVPFPELTDLQLSSNGETIPVIPDSFLDGSATRLRRFTLHGIPFPGLHKLLPSATHLVSLSLTNIPHSGYISPEAILALISVLSRLEILSLEFGSPQSRPDRETRRPPPSKRSVIPALNGFYFKGVIEYLEDLVTDIDTPQLKRMHITFFNQIDFDTPRLVQFINRTPKLENQDARVHFYDHLALLILSLDTLEIKISCKEPDWQLSSVEQVCDSFFHPLSTAEDLYIEHQYSELVWRDEAIENTQWLQLFLPFAAVKNLYLSKEFAPGIAAALQETVEGRITEVLPGLKNIFVEGLDPSGLFQKNIGRFLAARQLSDHSIAISDWNKNPFRYPSPVFPDPQSYVPLPAGNPSSAPPPAQGLPDPHPYVLPPVRY